MTETDTLAGGGRRETTGPDPVGNRAERLSSASLRRIIDPDVDIPGELGDAQLLPYELLSVAGLDLELSDEQRRTLAREEVASIMDAGVRFESTLNSGFSAMLLRSEDLTDPRITYMLHEVGEETRHSRLFIRLLEQAKPKARNPLMNRFAQLLTRPVLPLLIEMPAAFAILVLSGEEVPDRFQRLVSEHPDSDPFLSEVSRYHRAEEARHLSFARMTLPELWAAAGPIQRRFVRYALPSLITGIYTTIVHPGVYRTVGLPAWQTWRAVNRTPERLDLKHKSLRPMLATTLEAGVFRPGRIPRPWQKLCGVDRFGQPRLNA